MKLKHFSLIFSIVGILLLYSFSKFSQPPLIRIEEMKEHEGKEVVIIGTVTDYQITKYQSQIITIAENNHSTSIFLEGIIDVELGDKIKSSGEVQKYKDSYELIVSNLQSIEILKKWDNITYSLGQIVKAPFKYLGLNINLTGYIETISNDNFYLVDLKERLKLRVSFTKNINISMSPGEKVFAKGLFSFDKKNFRYELEISEEEHFIQIIS